MVRHESIAVALLAVVVLPVSTAAQPGLRTVELVHQRCVSELAVHEVTLFANGTVRIRERFERRRDMLLAELNPEELEDFVVRLGDVDLREVGSMNSGVSGDWVGQCSITLGLEGRHERFFRYGQFDTVPLGLKQLELIVGDLEQFARIRALHDGLPRDYQPEIGDFVRRRDGAVSEVVGFTSDSRGIELTGLDQPITIYVAVDDFRQVFVTLEDASLLDIEP